MKRSLSENWGLLTDAWSNCLFFHSIILSCPSISSMQLLLWCLLWSLWVLCKSWGNRRCQFLSYTFPGLWWRTLSLSIWRTISWQRRGKASWNWVEMCWISIYQDLQTLNGPHDLQSPLLCRSLKPCGSWNLSTRVGRLRQRTSRVYRWPSLQCLARSQRCRMMNAR